MGAAAARSVQAISRLATNWAGLLRAPTRSHAESGRATFRSTRRAGRRATDGADARGANLGPSVLEVHLCRRPAHDFAVSLSDGTEVWRWSSGLVGKDILEIRTLPAGEEVRLAADWDAHDNQRQPLPPDIDGVHGVLHCEPRDLFAPPALVLIKP
jgi:Intracellular proteinase inhibitor